MTLVRRTSPLGELVSLRQAMDRLFEDSFVRPRSWTFGGFDGYGFPVDVTNGSDSITIEVAGEFPGTPLPIQTPTTIIVKPRL